MVVLVLTACPVGLRGHLTRWLLEISPGVFVGQVSVRVRDLMWLRVLELCKDGKAILVYSADTEQSLAYRVHRHDWEPVDLDGIWLMLRPAMPTFMPEVRKGWSRASQARRARRKAK